MLRSVQFYIKFEKKEPKVRELRLNWKIAYIVLKCISYIIAYIVLKRICQSCLLFFEYTPRLCYRNIAFSMVAYDRSILNIIFTFMLIKITLYQTIFRYIFRFGIYTACENIQVLINPQYVVHRKRYFYRSLKYIRGHAININIRSYKYYFREIFTSIYLR